MTALELILAGCTGYSLGALAIRLGVHGPRHGDGQDRKFAFRRGRFVNRVSGEAIPLDEPVIIFRARDRHALPVLGYYFGLVEDPHHLDVIRERIGDFQRYTAANPERMKEPGVTRDYRLDARMAGPPREVRPINVVGYRTLEGGARYECETCGNRSRTPTSVEHEHWCERSPFYRPPPAPVVSFSAGNCGPCVCGIPQGRHAPGCDYYGIPF